MVEHSIRVMQVSLMHCPRLCIKTDRKSMQCADWQEWTEEAISEHAIVMAWNHLGHFSWDCIALPGSHGTHLKTFATSACRRSPDTSQNWFLFSMTNPIRPLPFGVCIKARQIQTLSKTSLKYTIIRVLPLAYSLFCMALLFHRNKRLQNHCRDYGLTEYEKEGKNDRLLGWAASLSFLKGKFE